LPGTLALCFSPLLKHTVHWQMRSSPVCIRAKKSNWFYSFRRNAVISKGLAVYGLTVDDHHHCCPFGSNYSSSLVHSCCSHLEHRAFGRTPWTSDQPVGRPLHNTNRINIYRLPCLEWDSNPRSQPSSSATVVGTQAPILGQNRCLHLQESFS
jgi:hypothetical protein